jgi:hypothetical protein
MKKEYFNEREKKLSQSFSENNDFFSNNYFGETKPILDKLIDKAEKRIVDSLKDSLLRADNDKARQEIKECIELFTKPKVLRVEDEIVSDKIINKILPKVEKDKKEEKPKEIVFNQPKRNSIDHSKYIYWCNPHTSINIGKLGSSQAWRNEKPTKSYY